MAQLFTVTTLVSLSITAVYAVGSLAAGFRLGRKCPRVEKWILSWLVFDALIHFTLVTKFHMFDTYIPKRSRRGLLVELNCWINCVLAKH